MNKEDVKKWMEDNLVRAEEARKLTGQKSSRSFIQSVQSGQISPFIVWGEGSGAWKLYERSEMEEYGRKLARRKGDSK